MTPEKIIDKINEYDSLFQRSVKDTEAEIDFLWDYFFTNGECRTRQYLKEVLGAGDIMDFYTAEDYITIRTNLSLGK
ncbi:MAG: hypothetical protein AAF717_21335 [Bacteroidota bacterium]|nr:hypothetical protein [uncultured Allomuricauda sp.]